VILYLDTSSLVKLFLEEEHSGQVRACAESAEVLATSRVAYPEALSALTRRHREGDLDEASFTAVCQALDEQWESFSQIDLDEKAAGELVVRHNLRAYDAVHLAAALEISWVATEGALFFTSFDRRLNEAARAEKLEVLLPPTADEPASP
jgi:predicted nucleic acid-binding protein